MRLIGACSEGGRQREQLLSQGVDDAVELGVDCVGVGLIQD
jgi:hypothetical protein